MVEHAQLQIVISILVPHFKKGAGAPIGHQKYAII